MIKNWGLREILRPHKNIHFFYWRTFFFPKAPETKFVVNQNHRKPYFLRVYAKKISPPCNLSVGFPYEQKSCFVVEDLVRLTYSVLERRGTKLSYEVSYRAKKKLRRCVDGVGLVDVSSVSPSLWRDGSSQICWVFISNIRECLFPSHPPSLQT